MAPWAVAAGLLVSFTAAAGNDPQSGVSAAARSLASRVIDPEPGLIPPVGAFAPSAEFGRPLEEARLQFELPLEIDRR